MPTTSIAVYDCADFCQQFMEYATGIFNTAQSGGVPFPISVLIADDAVDSSSEPFGFLVIRFAMDNPSAMFDTHRKQFLWFRPLKGVHYLTEADLLKERPWYHWWGINILGTPHPEWWETQLMPALANAVADLFACQITLSVATVLGPQAGYIKYARLVVGDSPDGHACFTAILNVANWKQTWAVTSALLGEQVVENQGQTYGDYDPKAGLITDRTIETDRQDGGISDQPIGAQLNELAVILRSLVDETARVADQKTSVSFNGGKIRVDMNPTGVSSAGS